MKIIKFAVLFFFFFVFLVIDNQTVSAKQYEKYVVRFIDAVTGDPIAGVRVTFEKKGQQVEAVTDKNGYVILSPFPFTEEDDRNGEITYEATAPNYSVLNDKSPCFQKEIALSPELARGEFRVVLSWGKKPWDLDSHLWYQSHHIYFRNKKSTYADLDRDDKAKYGPETITIRKIVTGTRYTYVVYNFSNRNSKSSDKLSRSDARVYIYSGGQKQPVKKYVVPKKTKGNKWVVFHIDENGQFVDINRIVVQRVSSGAEVTPYYKKSKR